MKTLKENYTPISPKNTDKKPPLKNTKLSPVLCRKNDASQTSRVYPEIPTLLQ